jgi:hypothetical protein
MTQHRYATGGRWGVPASAREYKVLRLLPPEGGDLLYRIKSAAETFERVAKERELTPVPKSF